MYTEGLRISKHALREGCSGPAEDLRGWGEVAGWLPPHWARTQPKEVPGHCADPLRSLPLCLFPGRRDTKASLYGPAQALAVAKELVRRGEILNAS